MNKNLKNMLLVSICFIFSNLQVDFSGLNALPVLSLAHISHADYEVPSHCGHLRKRAYESCASMVGLIAACSTCGIPGLCIIAPELLLSCDASLIVIPVCTGFVLGFEHCCSKLTDVPSEGWSRQMLRNASLCNACSGKENMIKSSCK